MGLTDLMKKLKQDGVQISESQIRWAIRTGAMSRPPMDGSLNFEFGPQNVQEIVELANRTKSRRRQKVAA